MLNMKKLLLLLCLIMSIFAMTACSNTETKAPFEYDKAELIANATAYLDSFNSQDLSAVTDEEYEAYIAENGEESQAQVDMWKSWGALQPELGAYISTTDTVVQNTQDSVVVKLTAKYEKDTLSFQVSFDKDLVPTVKTDIYRTISQKVQKALLNTVMCMGVVFVVLIFIAFIISLLKYIPIIIQKFTSSDLPEAKIAIGATTAAIAAVETAELSNDQELVAVITAAIMASMGQDAPKDGLIVRSIRKVNHEKWLRA